MNSKGVKLNWKLCGVALLVCILSILSYKYVRPAEDAVILYEYSKNLAHRGIITYGANTLKPIEGATDFLWMVLIALGSTVGIPEFGSALLISLVGTYLMLVLFQKEKLPFWMTVSAVLATPYLYATLNGFSPIFFAAVYMLSLYLVLNQSKWNYLSILVLCLIRPDGVLWGAGLIAFDVWVRIKTLNKQAQLKELLRGMMHLILPGLIYFGARAFYFKEWLPLPIIVKGSGATDIYWSLFAIVPILLPLGIALATLKERKKQFIVGSLILFVIPMLIYGTMRLEQNFGNRFMAPAFFGAVLFLARSKETRANAVFISVSVGLSLFFTGFACYTLIESHKQNVYDISVKLKEFQGKMLTTEAGRVAYYSNWEAEDSWGLNTPKYAHRLILTKDLVNANYDLITARCSIEDLDPNKKLTVDKQERSIGNHCETIVSYIKNSDYEVILVPFHKDISFIKKWITTKGEETCYRHHIFAISGTYDQKETLKQMLKDHGGIEYKQLPKSYRIQGDNVCISTKVSKY